MKLRIKGNSLRLRLGPAEIERLLETGRIEDTIRFAPEENAKLTYAFELGDAELPPSLRYLPGEVTVLVSRRHAQRWAHGDEVGISGESGDGLSRVELLIEKDFACLDHEDREGEDTFPNPKTGAVC